MDTSFASSHSELPAQRSTLTEQHGHTRGPLPFRRPKESATATGSCSPWSLSTGKRAVDLIGAGLGVLLLWPLLLLIAILVALSSPGPVIFRQKRVGRGSRLFTVYKFRTMEELREEVRGQRGVPSHTKRGDRRITPVGSVLRRYKLDELPQLFNVLKGDMSLVGPRPKLPHHEGMKMPFRPGLTGAATLVFRCEEAMLQDIPDHELEAYYARNIKPLKAKIDWDYMQRATFLSDMSLLYCTATACLFQAESSAWHADLSKTA